MKTSGRKLRELREALLDEARKAEQQMYDQESKVYGAIAIEDYSAAAVACHRAHQFKLVAKALTEQAGA